MAMVNNHYWNKEFKPAQFTGKTIWQAAHAMALQSPDTMAAALLENSLKNAKTQADIVRFNKSKTNL
ncbi:hypothetical protein [Parendozoicomonas sp. Alg238-R29]|uniref:hypothetical protein n=1 Tax=Parendozoicomonas sp. Alg238-R29 TaxID=2993446 RepID=UPI00248E9D1E|nr:hypothetical protein [Parendozoicomonas sp. Alg238-R29]